MARSSNRAPAARPQPATVARERITTHIRSILTEVAPDRVELLTPVVERCITSAVEPPQRAAAAMRAGGVFGTLNTGATSAGADLMARATELPFPQFVANLVTGTFDAIVASHIAQSKAYAELVADLAKTIQEFEVENVTAAQIDEWLAQNAPNGSGGTKIMTGAAYDQAVFTDIVDVRLEKAWNTTDVLKPPPVTATTWDQATVTAIRKGVNRHLATSGLQMLRAMARDGMQFVAVTNGEIHAKLTFNVTATDEQARTSNETDVSTRSFAAGASASWRWLRASASYGSSTLRVKSVNERTYNKVTMDAQLIGEVTLQFQTRTLPVIE